MGRRKWKCWENGGCENEKQRPEKKKRKVEESSFDQLVLVVVFCPIPAELHTL